MTQRKTEENKTPQTDEKESASKGVLLAEGSHPFFLHGAALVEASKSRYLGVGANITFCKIDQLQNLNLEDGTISAIKNIPEKMIYTNLIIGGNADPLSTAFIIHDHMNFAILEEGSWSVTSFNSLERFPHGRMIILDSSYILCSGESSYNAPTQLTIIDKSKALQKLVLPVQAGKALFVLRENENKFKLFLSCFTEGLYSVEIDFNRKDWFFAPVLELNIKNTAIFCCTISPDKQEIQLVLLDSPFDRSGRFHLQTRKFDDQWKTAEPLFDHDLSAMDYGKAVEYPYSSDSSFYFHYQKIIYQVNKGALTAIAELPAEFEYTRLCVTTDDRLIVLNNKNYYLYSTPCYELNCKIQAILPVILLRMQMPDQGAAAKLASSKDPWSIVKDYVGFFQPEPLKGADLDSARVQLNAAIAEMISSLPDSRLEKSLFKELLGKLQNSELSIKACAEEMEAYIKSNGLTPVNGFTQFLRDLVVAFPEKSRELKL